MSTPVRVDFDLRTPMVVYAGVKTLDALLSWAAVERAKFNGSLQEWSDQHQHGLQIHRVGQSWCPMASELDVEWASEAEPLHYVKRQWPEHDGLRKSCCRRYRLQVNEFKTQ